MLTVDDFPVFFAEMYGGAEPYSWQSAVLKELTTTGQWPDSIVAPTGSGKSAVADIHVFARALAVQDGLRIPRRLVLVVGRRALVDAQAVHARRLRERLRNPGQSSVMQTVASLLQGDCVGSDGPLAVSVIRGGITPDRGWIDHPSITQILCMTPDMFGSRLLHRGYGESRSARPRSAGMLAFDTAVILDEAHLNVQLSTTVHAIRRIVEEAPVAELVPPLQIVETTATPHPNTPPGVVVEETSLERSLESDRALGARLTAKKTPKLIGLESWPLPQRGAGRAEGLSVIVQSALETRSASAGTIGVILNRVADAVAVADQLRRTGFRTVLRVGPMQPLRGMQIAHEHPTLLSPEGDADVDFLVATQTIEVGVDLDLHGMVTEIASGPALVQRLGRVNRRGQYADALVTIVGPSDQPRNYMEPAPYTEEEIRLAWTWLTSLAAEVDDLSPSSLSRTNVPPSSRRRLTYERLAWADAEILSQTSEELFAEPELAIWLDDEMGATEKTAGVIGRELPSAQDQRLPLLQVTPPQDHEIYPTSIARLRQAFVEEKKRLETRRPRFSTNDVIAYLFRDSEWIAWEDENQSLRAGDVACFTSASPLTMEGVFLPSIGQEPIGDSLSAWRTFPSLAASLPWPRQVVYQKFERDDHGSTRADQDEGASLLYQIEQLVKDGEEPTLASVDEKMVAAGHGDWIGRVFDAQVDSTATGLRLDVAPPQVDGAVQWAVLSLESSEHLSEDSRQEWTSSGKVLLADHQRDVATRVAELAEAVGLDAGFTHAVAFAAHHHDDGKAHPYFQFRLGNRSGETSLLAKSGRSRSLSRSRTGGDGLPIGWRHEQYSVLLNADMDRDDRDLVLRLIGTTHGHGRGMFNQSARNLCTGVSDASLAARAKELFLEGEWDELMERTGFEHRWWGASYLEAILRAADCQISGEGR